MTAKRITKHYFGSGTLPRSDYWLIQLSNDLADLKMFTNEFKTRQAIDDVCSVIMSELKKRKY